MKGFIVKCTVHSTKVVYDLGTEHIWTEYLLQGKDGVFFRIL